jgi:hypothetical protein
MKQSTMRCHACDVLVGSRVSIFMEVLLGQSIPRQEAFFASPRTF